MSRRTGMAVLAGAAITAVLVYFSLFIIDPMQSALVLQFGQPRRVLTNPGPYLRWPLIESVVYLDNRVLNLESPATVFVMGDQKRIKLSAFVRYQIVDPLTFYRVVNNRINAESRIQSVLQSTLQQKLGDTSMTKILSPERARLMADITQELTARAAAPYGIRIVDVRFKAVDLPPQNSEAVFNQMRTQRAQEAAGIRADGARRALAVKAEADKERVVTLAEANKQSVIRRGEGDAEATRIYNEAFGKDPAFFDFFRSMQAMRDSLGGDNTTFVGAPSGDFFRYFDRDPGTTKLDMPLAGAPAPAPAPSVESPSQ
ncbi:MAG TPA: protease modulator HflC [Candidatus Binatia bacterium]|nr:protease modulator HflC [Candidatus Binatia bacterium]